VICKDHLMDRGTPFSLRVRQSLREELLDAATELLTAKGFQGLRMADVGTAVGVSRQTVYNEFGNKESLVQAVALRHTAEFLEGVEERLAGTDDPVRGARSATLYTLRRGIEDRLVASVLTGRDAADLLPFLTIKAQPLLDSATEVVRRHLQRCVPGLDAQSAALFAESVVRLVLSHLLMPTAEPREAAEAVAGVVAALLHPHMST
jgi:AcrR family transcriptional regulator